MTRREKVCVRTRDFGGEVCVIYILLYAVVRTQWYVRIHDHRFRRVPNKI